MFIGLRLSTIKRLFQIRSMVFTLTGITPRINDLVNSIILSVELDKLEEAFCSSEDKLFER